MVIWICSPSKAAKLGQKTMWSIFQLYRKQFTMHSPCAWCISSRPFEHWRLNPVTGQYLEGRPLRNWLKNLPMPSQKTLKERTRERNENEYNLLRHVKFLLLLPANPMKPNKRRFFAFYLYLGDFLLRRNRASVQSRGTLAYVWVGNGKCQIRASHVMVFHAGVHLR